MARYEHLTQVGEKRRGRLRDRLEEVQGPLTDRRKIDALVDAVRALSEEVEELRQRLSTTGR